MAINRAPLVSKGKNVNISDHELNLLKVVSDLGPCSSEQVHEQVHERFNLLSVMRTLHVLAEKGFLQRVIINKKQFYRTSKSYSYIISLLDNSRS